jgi:hypothetical protein
MDSNLGIMDPVREESGREIMRTPDEVTTILELQGRGWGAKRIARELGISKNTVKRYLQAGGRRPCRRPLGLGGGMGARSGWPGSIRSAAATPTWCAGSCSGTWAWRCRSAPLSERQPHCVGNYSPARRPPFVSRRRRAAKCELTSAKPVCSSVGSRPGCSCA